MVALVTPFDIEWEVESINMGKNTPHGAWLEREYGIVYNKDGVWNCRDRAELAFRLARKEGYKVRYKFQPNHIYVELTDANGVKHEILKRREYRFWRITKTNL